MRTAVCQFAATADRAANLEQCRRLISDAAEAGADLAVLPELAAFFDPRHDQGPGPHGEAVDGPFATAIAAAAADHHIAVVVGMLEAPGPQPGPQPGGERDYNTLLAFSATGEPWGSYRKIHLYNAFGYRESDVYLPGEITQPLLITVAGARVAALTCYDLRFPEIFRWVVDAGADVVVLPSAWIVGPAKEHHWHTLLTARAIENTVYVAGAGQTGPVCCGQSRIIDPMGTTIAGIGEQPGLAVGEIDVARVGEVRRTNPSLANRRFGIRP